MNIRLTSKKYGVYCVLVNGIFIAKLLSVVILFFIVNNSATAQWSGPLGNGNIYYANGNVGIKTSDIWDPLTVAGDLTLANAVNTTYTKVTGINFNNPMISGANATSNLARIYTITSGAHYASNLIFDVRSGSSTFEAMRLIHNGYLGVGTPNPNYRLDVNGHAHFNTYVDIGGQRNPNSATGGLNIYDTEGSVYTNIQMAQRAWGGSHAILFNAYKSNSAVNGDLTAAGNTKYSNDVGSFQSGAGMIHFGGNTGYMDFYISPNSTGQNTNVNWQVPVLSLRRSGNVGIGTTNPDHKLTVDGGVKCEEVRVEIFEGTGPDYVFEKDYDLLPLSELETYITQNKHLPEVPSAKEMEANGLNLKEMNLLLLKKVEELTLHLIDHQKEIKELKKEMRNLKRNK